MMDSNYFRDDAPDELRARSLLLHSNLQLMLSTCNTCTVQCHFDVRGRGRVTKVG